MTMKRAATFLALIVTAMLWTAGLFFGLAVSVKWSAFYAVFGVILLLCYYFARETIDSATAGPGRPPYWRDRVPRFLGLWFGAFVLVPFAIYYLSYSEYLESLANGPGLFTWDGVRAVAAQQLGIFNYHAGLTSTHPYSSAYYTWPYLGKPVWLLVDDLAAPGVRSSISLMGNPLIWWSGLVAMAALLWRTLGRLGAVGVFLSGAYLTQFLPWALIDRVTFLYHYFPSLTFLILALAYAGSRLDPARRENQALLGVFGLAVLVLFVMFYPAISGLPVAEGATAMLRWLPEWGIL